VAIFVPDLPGGEFPGVAAPRCRPTVIHDANGRDAVAPAQRQSQKTLIAEITHRISAQKFRDHGQEARAERARPVGSVGLCGVSMTVISHSYAL